MTEFANYVKHYFTQKGVKVKGVRGLWVRQPEAYEIGMSDNLAIFIQEMEKSNDVIKAAMETPTGRMANALGYKVIKPEDVEIVKIDINKPSSLDNIKHAIVLFQ